jgi:formiminotetrahydrofolate cyclodeaminase
MGFAALPLEAYLDRLASKDPTPGGGTASAIAGASACALGEMVLGLTLGREKYAAVQAELAPMLPDLTALRLEFLRLADEDSRAYASYMEAMRLPKGNAQEQEQRTLAMRRAARRAAEVPLRTAAASVEASRRLAVLAAKGNPNARSDAIVGALHAWTALQGATLNVQANLDGMGDAALAQAMRRDLERFTKEAEDLLARARSSAR